METEVAGQSSRLSALRGRPTNAGAPGRKVKRTQGKAHRHRRFHGYREEPTTTF